MKAFIELLTTSISQNTFIEAIWSNPRKKQDSYQKMVARRIELKGLQLMQFNLLEQNKSFHENIAFDGLESFVNEHTPLFKQIQVYTTEKDFTILINKKGHLHIKDSKPTKKQAAPLTHNREKNYLLDPTSSATFLTALGLMGKNQTINPSKYDKYKQINKYLEYIDSVLPSLPKGPLRIVDFGCGKSYLTFAMYHYLHEIKKIDVEVVGLDLKKDVIAFCQELAKTLHYDGLFFQVGDIGSYTTHQPIDIVVSLHACNTATDAALLKAVSWQAKAILAVPCCHHEAYSQIDSDLLAPILKHGILKERIAALVTDGLRAEMLEAYGYKVTVMEFIDMQHTPKNILIRALRTGKDSSEALKSYQKISSALTLDLSIAKKDPFS